MRGTRAWYLLLLAPLVGLLWVPIYAKADPELFGFPFFYWYQFLLVPLSVAITFFVYTRTRTRGTPPQRRAEPPGGFRRSGA
jgi:membrane protein implicated in regulation of membrane protease activity